MRAASSSSMLIRDAEILDRRNPDDEDEGSAIEVITNIQIRDGAATTDDDEDASNAAPSAESSAVDDDDDRSSVSSQGAKESELISHISPIRFDAKRAEVQKSRLMIHAYDDMSSELLLSDRDRDLAVFKNSLSRPNTTRSSNYGSSSSPSNTTQLYVGTNRVVGLSPMARQRSKSSIVSLTRRTSSLLKGSKKSNTINDNNDAEIDALLSAKAYEVKTRSGLKTTSRQSSYHSSTSAFSSTSPIRKNNNKSKATDSTVDTTTNEDSSSPSSILLSMKRMTSFSKKSSPKHSSSKNKNNTAPDTISEDVAVTATTKTVETSLDTDPPVAPSAFVTPAEEECTVASVKVKKSKSGLADNMTTTSSKKDKPSRAE